MFLTLDKFQIWNVERSHVIGCSGRRDLFSAKFYAYISEFFDLQWKKYLGLRVGQLRLLPKEDVVFFVVRSIVLRKINVGR
jgi:hypothetical protein